MSGLEIKQITKTYTEGEQEVIALHETSLVVQPSELVAIIGPSGSGKSTLLAITGALLQATSGDVVINGTSLSSLNEKELAAFRLHHIGFILQTANLLPYLTAQEQVELMAKMKGSVTKEEKERANQLLAMLGLGEKTTKRPHELSGGERQRIAIARAFMNKPALLLADEPTASLDSKRAFEVVETMARVVKEQQVAGILVTHDERMLPYCDHVYRMNDGMLEREETNR